MSDMFLYTVKPRKAIIGLSGSTKVVRTNKSLYLSKEDVLICLKNAIVYRRFANEGINERVTIDNVDRVHRENYIAESDWAAFCAQEKSKDHGTVINPDPVVEENEKEEEITPTVEEVVESAPEESIEEESEQPVTEVFENNDDGTETSDQDDEDTIVESDDDEVVEKTE